MNNIFTPPDNSNHTPMDDSLPVFGLMVSASPFLFSGILARTDSVSSCLDAVSLTSTLLLTVSLKCTRCLMVSMTFTPSLMTGTDHHSLIVPVRIDSPTLSYILEA